MLGARVNATFCGLARIGTLPRFADLVVGARQPGVGDRAADPEPAIAAMSVATRRSTRM
jgi:hypothetical protein